MNQYHIYEEIGRRKHSMVYKGRKKKTIEYYAIKSVDKSQKSKVMQEVRILHSLDHANVLKFYSWYETSAHLWLVLEYCVGGDLRALLDQDRRLPEDSVHDLAFDLVQALLFLHSKGVIYCDLKPSNILLDENGRVKLCDFGLARRLSDISKNSLSQMPQAKRGTPFYMAPELFQEGGVHSYASDLWALGCVLYECYAGNPPFPGDKLTKVVKSTLSDPVPPLPDNPSNHFVNLIDGLMMKDPAERLHWPELCEHGFWRRKLTMVPLPPQSAFDAMVRVSARSCLSECNGEKPLQHRTPPKYRERDSSEARKQDENLVSMAKGFETPTKNVPGIRKAQTKVSGRAVEEKQEVSSAVKGVNILRLSRIAKSNLEKENECENYRRPLNESPEVDNEVKIVDIDMELDFSENNNEEGANEESDGSDNQACRTPVPEAKLPIQGQEQERIEETDNNRVDIPPNINTVLCHSSKQEEESCSEHVEVAATPPGVGLQRRAQRVQAYPVTGSDSSKSSTDLSQVLWHPSDLSVRPVMPSRKTDKASEAMPALPFDALPASDFVKLPPEHLDGLTTRIITSLSGNSSVSEKQNAIRFLEILSGNADAANILTNGQVMLMLVKMLRLSKASVLRVQLVSVIGLLIRHSTFIEASLASSGIVGALTDGLRDKNEKVRRFSMAALGELLFYISTQNESSSRDGSGLESPSKDNKSASGWQVPNALIALVSSILRKGEDDITQLYALRTIENISSQGVDWATRFASPEVIGNLCYIFKATAKQESIRLAAGSCLVRLVRFSPPNISAVIEKLSFKETISALIKGNPREQQISINLLNMATLGSLLSQVEEKLLAPCFVSLIEQGSEVLRGKAFVSVALLCKNNSRCLPQFFCTTKFLSVVDKLAKEKDSYVQQCIEAFVQVVSGLVPGLLETVLVDIQQPGSGKRHGQIAALAGRANSKANIHLTVILHLIGSSIFKHKVVSGQVLQQLGVLIKLLKSPLQGRDDFQITLLRILESITEEPAFVLGESGIFIGQFIPCLAVLCKGNKDKDARFLCLKILFDLIVVLLPDTSTPGNDQRMKDLKSVSKIHFLPLYPTLIADEDPMPMYAQKLLVMLIDFNYVQVSDILHLKTVTQCFEFLLDDLSTANVNNVKLCLAVASASELETKMLSQLRVVKKIGNFLELVNAGKVEDFLEPTLALCKALLLRSTGIEDITDFTSSVGVFLELSGSHEARIAELASECLSLLLEAAPREAATRVLTSVPKITVALESCRRCCQGSELGASSLSLLHLLHAFAFSCRECRSQAAILSISKEDIMHIEGIVCNLRSSSTPGIAHAAADVGLELQRLPHCL